jgi:hypothetical protein
MKSTRALEGGSSDIPGRVRFRIAEDASPGTSIPATRPSDPDQACAVPTGKPQPMKPQPRANECISVRQAVSILLDIPECYGVHGRDPGSLDSASFEVLRAAPTWCQRTHVVGDSLVALPGAMVVGSVSAGSPSLRRTVSRPAVDEGCSIASWSRAELLVALPRRASERRGRVLQQRLGRRSVPGRARVQHLSHLPAAGAGRWRVRRGRVRAGTCVRSRRSAADTGCGALFPLRFGWQLQRSMTAAARGYRDRLRVGFAWRLWLGQAA